MVVSKLVVKIQISANSRYKNKMTRQIQMGQQKTNPGFIGNNEKKTDLHYLFNILIIFIVIVYYIKQWKDNLGYCLNLKVLTYPGKNIKLAYNC